MILFAPDVQGPLFQVAANGGTAQPVVQTPVASFLPDGRHFLFLVPGTEGAGSRLYAGAFNSKTPTPVLDRVYGMVAYSADHLLFVREGTLLAQPFSSRQLRTTGSAVPVVEHEFSASFEPS